jgi:hypothetical protein
MAILSERIEKDVITVDVKSSNIKSASYNTSTKVLVIEFNNDIKYEYENVEWEIFTKFRMSESQGKFFNQKIQKSYKFKKLI